MNDFKEWIIRKEQTSKHRKNIAVDCFDQENCLEDLLNYIQKIGNIGHSFSIVVDPDNQEYEKKFFWDGDGADRIYSVKNGTNETMTSTGSIATFARPAIAHVRRGQIPTFAELEEEGKKKKKKKPYKQPQVED